MPSLRFGRFGVVPDEWAVGWWRSTVAQAIGAEDDYAQAMAFAEAQLMTEQEAADLVGILRDEWDPFVFTPRMTRLHGLHYEDFISDEFLKPDLAPYWAVGFRPAATLTWNEL